MVSPKQKARRRTVGVGAIAACAAMLACAASTSRADAKFGGDSGAVYTETNALSGNAVVAFHRAADGALTPGASTPTGGTGTGVGLGSQGAVVLSEDGSRLFAVNAGSSDISEFAVSHGGLKLLAKTPSGGVMPISLAIHGDLLYALNAGGAANNITGFHIHWDGALTAIPASARSLSGPSVSPAEAAFSPDGDLLVVTERATNLIDTYRVRRDGTLEAAVTTPSSGAVPYGFGFSESGTLVVTEASGFVSSYDIENGGSLSVITASAPTYGVAPCWMAITPDQRYAYAANAHGGTITGFSLARDGALALLESDGLTADTGTGSAPLDMAIDSSGRYLHVLVAGLGGVDTFRIEQDGSLTAVGGPTGSLPSSVTGLATN